MNEFKPPSLILDEIANGYRASQVLFTAIRLGIFELIGNGRMTFREIANATDSNPRGIRIICDALCSLGILSKEKDFYFNNGVSRQCLLADSPEPKTAILRHGARLYEKWGRLFDAVQEGRAVSENQLDPRLNHGKTGFAEAMQNTAQKSASQTADQLNLSSVNRLLDLGGGPGLYAIECCRRNPDLQAFLLDDHETLEVARNNIQSAGLSDRIQLIAGDMLTHDFPTNLDLVLLSNVLHIFSAQKNRSIIKKAFAALNRGGQICLKDFFLDSTRTQPAWVALFAVNMLVNTDEGDCYTLDEVQEWLMEAGFTRVRNIEVTPLSTAILGNR
jgi:ubiquinone/menaquinone biosynthesis C-methylase UbiE